MIRAFYSGKTGLGAQQTSMDTISNNIANVNTTGFMSKSTEFSDVLYSSMVRPDNPAYTALLSGNGVAASADAADMSAGTAQQTDGAYDYMPKAEGFFAVADATGNTYFTRDGSFGVMQDPAGNLYLGNAEGQYVLDATGAPILIGAGGTPMAVPGVFTFSNPAGLLNAGDNLYAQSNISGAPAVSDEGVVQGELEGSNVDLAKEMANLIVTQRGFQMSSRVLQTADQIEDMTNSLGS